MTPIERAGLFALHRLDAERAHSVSLWALRNGLVPLPSAVSTARQRTRIAGLTLANPIGLAAGYDKNATAIAPLIKAGFGYIEVGAATPRPQPGNPKPRLFRLTGHAAAINRFGFNNDGMDVIAGRLRDFRQNGPAERGIVGLNLGANKTSIDRAADYVRVLKRCGDLVDFVTINVSSPNTKNLRDLQAADALAALLDRVLSARETLATKPAVFLKIAPDLDLSALDAMSGVVLRSGIDALVATNTTVSRTGVSGPHSAQAGGLSGAPLFEPSTRILALLAQRLDAQLPLIGVGGVGSARDAYQKIRAGASAIQLYTAMVFQGLSVVTRIASGLDHLLAADGFSNVSEAVGLDRDTYT